MNLVCSSALLDYDDLVLFVITEDYSDSMAVFDDAWRLVGWTKQVRKATIFDNQEQALDVIRRLSLVGSERAVRSGRLLWELDEDLNEFVFAAPNGGPIILQPRADVLEPGPSWGKSEIAFFTRQEFAEAQRKGNRAHGGIGPRDLAGREYLLPVGVLPTRPISRRAAIASACLPAAA